MEYDIKHYIIGQLVEQNTLMSIELRKVAAEKAKATEAETKAEEDRVAGQAKNRPANPPREAFDVAVSASRRAAVFRNAG